MTAALRHYPYVVPLIASSRGIEDHWKITAVLSREICFMRDLARPLEPLRQALAEARHEISILNQITVKLKAIVDRGDGGGIDAQLDRHFHEIDTRMAMALARHASATHMLDGRGREPGGRFRTRLDGIAQIRAQDMTPANSSTGKKPEKH